jgi:transcriptional repressor NrdR
MRCLYCFADTEVTNSRLQRRSNNVWRRRQCKACRAVFTTHEAIDLSSAMSVAKNGHKEPFKTDLLFTELLLALQDRKKCYDDAREATHTIIQKLLKLPSKPLFEAHQISRVTADVLLKLDHRAYLRFVSEHPSLQG